MAREVGADDRSGGGVSEVIEQYPRADENPGTGTSTRCQSPVFRRIAPLRTSLKMPETRLTAWGKLPISSGLLRADSPAARDFSRQG